MLPIAAEIAVRMTRQQAQSALPNAPVLPDHPAERRRRTPSRSKRTTAVLLRRVAARSAGLADRIERPAGA